MSTKADNDSNFFSKTWELNIYELNRMPHEIIYDETQIAVSPKILQNELMCPICLDILKDTMTTKECLHRFCHDCIITALRAGNKECPTCRKKLVSKRSLRPDPNIDGIISIIYPNREELDALHEKVLEKLNKKHLTAINGSATVNSGVKVQRQGSKRVTQRRPVNDDASSNHSNQPPPTTSNGRKRNRVLSQSEVDSDVESRSEQSSQMNHDTDDVEVTLKPHPEKETNYLMEKFIKTAPIASVDHLSIYLTSRVGVEASNSFNPVLLETNKSFSIYANDPKTDALVELPSTLTLEQIIEKYSRQPSNKVIELFYHYIAQSS